ncbi:MAG: Ig-like domain-containing protein [Anaerovoracaceae bacterium]
MKNKLLTWVTTLVVTTVMVLGGSASVFADTTQVSVKVSPKVLELEKGETETITATVKPADSGEEVSWDSSNEKVAKVESGKVTAVGKGMAAVTATCGDAEATCVVTVEEGTAPEKITVKAADDSKVVMAKGYSSDMPVFATDGSEDTFYLEVSSVTPETASKKVKWSSSDSSVSISRSGKVTVPAGIKSSKYVRFTAASVVNSSVKAEFAVYILPVLSINVRYAEYGKTYIQIPENGVVNRTGNYVTPTPSQYRDYNMSEAVSEDGSIVKIVDNMYMHPVKAGSCKVTVQDKYNSWNKASSDITVKGFFIRDAEDAPEETYVDEGSTVQLRADTDAEVTSWTSSDDKVAKIDDKGLVTAFKAGQTTIAAETADGKATYKVNVREKGKVYPEKMYLASSPKVYTDEECKTAVKNEQNYLNSTTTTMTTAHYMAVTDTSARQFYLTESNSAQKMNIGIVFDNKKVKAEILKDGEKAQTMESEKTTNVALEPGDNTFTLRVTSLEDEKNYTDYVYKVRAGYSSNEKISSVALKTSARAMDNMKKYKPAGATSANTEGVLYRVKADGTVDTKTRPGFNATWYDYKAYLYDDAEDVILTAKTTDTVSGHIAYSTDEGKTWTEGSKSVTTDALKLSADKSTKIQLKCVSDKAYRAAKADGRDPFEDEAVKTYTIDVEKLSADVSDKTIIKSVSFDKNCKECTPNYRKGAKAMAALVAHDADTATVTITADKDVTLYNNRTASDAYKMTKIKDDENGDAVYELTIDTLLKDQGNQITQYILSVYNGEDGSTVEDSYTLYLFKKGTKYGTLKGTPDKITDYLCTGSQYTNGGNTGWGIYGLFPEKIFMDAGNWYTCVSLGNFGGYMTLYYDKPITDDPNNVYGVDFTVFGNSNGGQSFSEPGNVLVSEDGKTWYSLAGSEHYDATSRWDYEVTYKKSSSDIADYSDNDGNGGSLGTGWAPYQLPKKNLYPLYNWTTEDQITVKGTRLYTNANSKGAGIESGSALLPAFGYFDVQKNSTTVAGTGEDVNLLTTPVGNPYMKDYDGYGDGFDLKWAVDEKGDPVDVKDKEFHYVKVQTASFINAGAIGEKSAEISSIVRTTPEKESIGTTAAPEKLTVAGTDIKLSKDKDVYYVQVPEKDEYKVSVKAAADDTNIYINNERTDERTFEGLPDKGIIRVIVQEGNSNPVIYYIHTSKAGDNAAADVASMIASAKDDSDFLAAKKAYDALSDADKENVFNADKLNSEISRIDVKNTVEAIDAIGTVDASSKDKIDAARAAYDKLSDKEKDQVDNYQKLVNAEMKYENMKLKDELAKTKFDAVKIKLSYSKATYSGKAKKPAVKITYYGRALTKGKDYEIAYKDNKNVGKAKVTVTGKGSYAGTKVKTFRIVPEGTSISKVTKGKKQFTVKWKKQSTQTTGYQIRYSTSSKFSKAKTVTVKKNTTASKVVKKLKANKKYYVKVRTYKKIGNSTYYSTWSSSKTVKTK